MNDWLIKERQGSLQASFKVVPFWTIEINLVPRVSRPSLAPGVGEVRDPGNEVGSRSGPVIQDTSDHGASKEPIHQFIWYTTILVILDYKSYWSKSSKRNVQYPEIGLTLGFKCNMLF